MNDEWVKINRFVWCLNTGNTFNKRSDFFGGRGTEKERKKE